MSATVNGQPETRTPEWELQHLHALVYDEIGMCGCGWGDDAYSLIRDLLDHFHDRDGRDVAEMIGSTAAAQLVLYRLQEADLIDHGTRVTGSWMTDKGRYARHLMHRHPWWDARGEDGRTVPGAARAGYPECWDWDTDRCPEGCWAPPADVPAQPPGPSMGELVREASRMVEDACAKMSPAQVAAFDQVSKATEHAMLYGDFAAPLEPVAVDWDRLLAAQVWNTMMFGPLPGTEPSSPSTGLFSALGGVTPSAPDWRAELGRVWSGTALRGPDRQSRVLDWMLRTDDARNGPPGRAQWAPQDCICPWPWPLDGEHVRLDCTHRREPTKPVVGRNPQVGCRKVDASWIHGRPHDCPIHARGAR